ncbi:MAG: transporter [Marmoricola sp.]|nr:transporter [Marmoricola sp.]
MAEQDGARDGALAVRGLTVRYDGVPATDDVDVDVPAGSVTAVLGPSGCGKSTLLRAIAGLEQPDAGSISYAGADLARVPTHRRGFALMFQDGQLFPHTDVAGNVGYALRLRRWPKAQVRSRVEELLELVGLDGFGPRMPQTLSGGERQRVALARSLAVEPRLLLLDEPLSALDRGLRERLAADLHDILRRAGTTTLLVTHDHDEAFAIADRMVVMRAGRVVQAGELAEVWRQPADAWAARFLGYADVLDGDAAAALRTVIAPEEQWTQIALRRSALVVDPAGALLGTVLAARATPDQIRLELEVDRVGRVGAVAEPGSRAQVGDRVRIGVRTDRVAVLPGTV